jgi:hypothetical protein
MTTKNRFPPGWNETRVQRVLDHYEGQADEEALAEDEERYDSTHTVMEAPKELVPTIRKFIAKTKSA